MAANSAGAVRLGSPVQQAAAAHAAGQLTPAEQARVTADINRQIAAGPRATNPTAGGATPPAATTSVAAGSGGADMATIRSLLHQENLDALYPFVEGWVRQNLSWAEILVQLDDVSTEPGKIVDAMYPERRAFREANPSMPPLSIAGIQSYKQRGVQELSRRGLLGAFPDVNKTLGGWLVGNKSIDEQLARLDVVKDDVAGLLAGDPVLASEMEAYGRFYGVTSSLASLVAHVLNPGSDLPTLLGEQQAVLLDRSAGQAGFGDLSRGEAERIAGWHVDPFAAKDVFGTLSGLGEVVGNLPGESGDVISRDDQLAAGFGGNANAQRRIAKKTAQRKADFQGGGGYASDKTGFSGLGTAR